MGIFEDFLFKGYLLKWKSKKKKKRWEKFFYIVTELAIYCNCILPIAAAEMHWEGKLGGGDGR